VIIEAPRGPSPTPQSPDTRLTVAAVAPYTAACDIHGIDIYPVSIPPGLHAGGRPVNTDISVVGDMTRLIARATGRKAIWTTLQIAWSGVLPPHPLVFPTLAQARFMAYDAIVAGARGLFFFGGQVKQAMNQADREHGWNWTYWKNVQRPLLEELAAAEHAPALTAPTSGHAIQGQRCRHRAQRPRGRPFPVPDRGPEESDPGRRRAVQRATGRHSARHCPRTPGRQSRTPGHRHPRCVQRPEPVRAPQRARLPLPTHPLATTSRRPSASGS